MSKVIIMRGVPGSGKSNLAQRVKLNNSSESSTKTIVSADNFHINEEGDYNWDPAKIGEAHAECFKSFVDALRREDELIVVDNTNTQLHEMSPYVMVADLHNAEVEFIHTICSLDEAFARCTHGVPRETIQTMWERTADLPKHWPKQTVVATD